MILSVIIVNYNVRPLLEACLRSVISALKDINAEIIVIDNASTDGSIEYLAPLFQSARFISNKKNEGFAKANNRGLAMAMGQYILFLNPDTLVPADCFSKCIAFMQSHTDAGALGVKMVNGEGKFLRESKRAFPTPAVSFWKLSGIAALLPRSSYFAKYYHGDLNQHSSHVVGVLSGAFMLVRKDVLNITGGFDERFFMYAEDVDLSYRIQQAGFKNYYFAGVTIVHYKGKSTKKDWRYVQLFYKAMSQFVKKYHGRGLFTMLLDAAIWMRSGVEFIKTPFKKK